MLKDTDLMPWGKHVGIAMIDVPSDYLLYLYDNFKCHGEVKQYIEDNLDALKLESHKKQFTHSIKKTNNT